VAAAQILQEGMAGDHELRCPIGLQPTHRSQSALELADDPDDDLGGELDSAIRQ
jgi:hypothetical protein